MRVLYAIFLAAAVAGAAAAQVIQALPPAVKQPPAVGSTTNLARSGQSDVAATNFAEIESKTRSVADQISALRDQLLALRDQREQLTKSREEWAGKLRDELRRDIGNGERAEHQRRVEQLEAQVAVWDQRISAIDDKMNVLVASLEKLGAELEKLEAALKEDQARTAREIEQRKGQQQKNQSAQANNQSLQEAVQRQNRAVALMAEITKKRSDVSSLLAGKSGG